MEPGLSWNSHDENARLDYHDWLDDVAKNGLVDEQNECENISVECTVSVHQNCTRATCQCVCHIVYNV